MDNVKQWLKNLRKPDHEPNNDEFAEKTLMRPMTADPKESESYWSVRAVSMSLDIRMLKKQLSDALLERKTCTKADLRAQLAVVLDAQSALAHQKLLGVNEKSEMSKIVSEHLRQEMAKLQFLMFEDIDVPDEQAEDIISALKSRD